MPNLSRLIDSIVARAIRAALHVTGTVEVCVCRYCKNFMNCGCLPYNGKQIDVSLEICDGCLERFHGGKPEEG